MRFKDLIWILVLIVLSLVLIIDDSREVFLTYTNNYPYIMGFVKTAVLATMGEMLAFRILTGHYKGIVGITYKFIIWGLIGLSLVLVIPLFSQGVAALQQNNLLPSIKNSSFISKLVTAFLTSLLMNLIFAPTFMAFHRITDTYIELSEGKMCKIIKVKFNSVVDKINWNHYAEFVVFKTIPFFWIPAHTITFLLPEEYRVLMAASLSIALGLILSISKKQKIK